MLSRNVSESDLVIDDSWDDYGTQFVKRSDRMVVGYRPA
jgi:hypothetical protein